MTGVTAVATDGEDGDEGSDGVAAPDAPAPTSALHRWAVSARELVRAPSAPGPERWAARAFLLVALPVGLVFVFVIPPSQVVDEESHFLRAWQLSGLNLFADVREDPESGFERNGAVFDVCVVEYIREFAGAAQVADNFSMSTFWFDTPDCSPRNRDFVITDAATGYGPWSYPGEVTALAISRAAGLPLPVAFYAGRLAGLLVFTSAIWAALRIAPAARLTMMFVALLPMSLMSAVAYNSDGVMIAGSILAAACALRLALHETQRARQLLLVMTLALACVVVSKPTYVVLVGLLLLVPAARFGSRRAGRWLLAGSAAAVVVPAVAWYRISQGADTGPIFYAGTDPAAQLRSVISDPFGFLVTVWDTLFSYTYEVFFLRGWLGVYGMFRIGRPEVAPLLAVPWIIVAAGALAVTVAVEAGERREMPTIDRVRRQVVAYGILIGGPLAIFFTAYLMWTVPGADVIEGVQGRYMLPFIPVAAVAAALIRHRSTARFSIRGVVIVSVLLALASLNQMVALFY